MDVQSDDIPPAGLVPLNTNEEILARVSQLLDADARQLPSVVVLFLDSKARELPVVVPLDGIPSRPDMPTVSNLCWIIAQVLDEHAPGGSAILTLTRPGPHGISPDDRLWRDAITNAAEVEGAPIRMLCLGTRDGVCVLDDQAG